MGKLTFLIYSIYLIYCCLFLHQSSISCISLYAPTWHFNNRVVVDREINVSHFSKCFAMETGGWNRERHDKGTTQRRPRQRMSASAQTVSKVAAFELEVQGSSRTHGQMLADTQMQQKLKWFRSLLGNLAVDDTNITKAPRLLKI